ncbi:MAG: UDP-N-acetylmuramate--L-alanine ligase [Bacteroidetes bacterium]|nr:UDP-N-acetylmuramate--L-alanine ligase [Bacteroidota bacterium]
MGGLRMKMNRRQPWFGQIRHVHMIGIGGIGMSSIAHVLLARGYRVTGSDIHLSEITDQLQQKGAIIHEGHHQRQVKNADVVVYSSAVNPDTNTETQAALANRTPLIPRSEMLGELMRMKYGIAIAGTHGKTTTTSLVGHVIAEGGFDPTVIVGGKVTQFNSNALSGDGDIIVIEADEYDRTFLRLTPALAVITCIEEEHLDVYSDLSEILDAFSEFAVQVPFFGAAIVCLDDPGVLSILPKIDRRLVTYGTSRQAMIRAERITHDQQTTRFDVIASGKQLGTIQLKALGVHNVLNALAAVAVGLELDLPFEHIQSGLEKFSGVRRRFQIVSQSQDIIVVDDYAHHPTEVLATLDAASQGYPDRRLICVFQPHLYSRTIDFQQEFASSFFNANVLIVTDIYSAREQPISGITGELIVDLASAQGHRDARYIHDRHQIIPILLEEVQSGDLVVFMGAGDIWRTARQYCEQLCPSVAA